MRDSSVAQNTYWLRDGLYYGKARTLGESACVLPEDKLASIPADDRKLLIEEAAADRGFCSAVAALMRSDGNWAHKLSDSAKAAIRNEINPRAVAPGRWRWPKLRARARGLLSQIPADIDRAVSKMTLPQKLEVVRKIASSGKATTPVSGLGDLGQWDIIASLVGNIGTAAAGIYGAKVTTEAQKDIAKLQANAAMQSAQAQMALSSAQAAVSSAQAQMAPAGGSITSALTSTVGGIPVLLIPVGLFLAWRFLGR